MCMGFIVLKVNCHWRHFHQLIKDKGKYSSDCFLVSQTHIYIAYVIQIKSAGFSLFTYIIYFRKNTKSTKREYFLILMIYFKICLCSQRNSLSLTMKVIDYKWTWLFSFSNSCVVYALYYYTLDLNYRGK